MKPTDDELDALLKRLHLANARKIWQKLVEQAEKEQWSYRDFLALLIDEEIAQRQQTRLGWQRSACGPHASTGNGTTRSPRLPAQIDVVIL